MRTNIRDDKWLSECHKRSQARKHKIKHTKHSRLHFAMSVHAQEAVGHRNTRHANQDALLEGMSDDGAPNLPARQLAGEYATSLQQEGFSSLMQSTEANMDGTAASDSRQQPQSQTDAQTSVTRTMSARSSVSRKSVRWDSELERTLPDDGASTARSRQSSARTKSPSAIFTRLRDDESAEDAHTNEVTTKAAQCGENGPEFREHPPLGTPPANPSPRPRSKILRTAGSSQSERHVRISVHEDQNNAVDEQGRDAEAKPGTPDSDEISWHDVRKQQQKHVADPPKSEAREHEAQEEAFASGVSKKLAEDTGGPPTANNQVTMTAATHEESDVVRVDKNGAPAAKGRDDVLQELEEQAAARMLLRRYAANARQGAVVHLTLMDFLGVIDVFKLAPDISLQRACEMFRTTLSEQQRQQQREHLQRKRGATTTRGGRLAALVPRTAGGQSITVEGFGSCLKQLASMQNVELRELITRAEFYQPDTLRDTNAHVKSKSTMQQLNALHMHQGQVRQKLLHSVIIDAVKPPRDSEDERAAGAAVKPHQVSRKPHNRRARRFVIKVSQKQGSRNAAAERLAESGRAERTDEEASTELKQNELEHGHVCDENASEGTHHANGHEGSELEEVTDSGKQERHLEQDVDCTELEGVNDTPDAREGGIEARKDSQKAFTGEPTNDVRVRNQEPGQDKGVAVVPSNGHKRVASLQEKNRRLKRFMMYTTSPRGSYPGHSRVTAPGVKSAAVASKTRDEVQTTERLQRDRHEQDENDSTNASQAKSRKATANSAMPQTPRPTLHETLPADTGHARTPGSARVPTANTKHSARSTRSSATARSHVSMRATTASSHKEAEEKEGKEEKECSDGDAESSSGEDGEEAVTEDISEDQQVSGQRTESRDVSIFS